MCGRGKPTMSALAIRDDIGSEELRRRARRESDGRVSARLIAIANALEGLDRASAARLAGMDRQTMRDWVRPLQRGRDCRAVQSASAGTQAEADRGADRGIESGRTGRSRSGSGQNRAVAHRRSVPVGGGALGASATARPGC
jgi:transposase-like protein